MPYPHLRDHISVIITNQWTISKSYTAFGASMKNLASDDVTASSRVHIADDSIEDSRMSNGRNYGQCNEITVYGEQYIYELQLTYAGDPI